MYDTLGAGIAFRTFVDGLVGKTLLQFKHVAVNALVLVSRHPA